MIFSENRFPTRDQVGGRLFRGHAFRGFVSDVDATDHPSWTGARIEKAGPSGPALLRDASQAGQSSPSLTVSMPPLPPRRLLRCDDRLPVSAVAEPALAAAGAAPVAAGAALVAVVVVVTAAPVAAADVGIVEGPKTFSAGSSF